MKITACIDLLHGAIGNPFGMQFGLNGDSSSLTSNGDDVNTLITCRRRDCSLHAPVPEPLRDKVLKVMTICDLANVHRTEESCLGALSWPKAEQGL